MTELHPFLARLAEAGAYEPPSRPQTPRNGAGHWSAPPSGDPQAARYAAGALTKEAQRLAGTPEGQRNNAANTSAFRMGQLVAHGWLNEDAARDELIDAAMSSGLSHMEAERTVISGLTAGIASPRSDVELRIPVPVAYTITETALGGGQVFGASHDVGTNAATDAASGEEPTTPQRPRQLIDGGPFIHSNPADVPALWGESEDVLWARGEPLIITGPTGVGKTTLGTNVIAGRLGLVPEVLGLPVVAGHKKVLVLAMDRPAQIRRAMARLLRQFPEEVLSERLIVWQGPPPMDIGRHPMTLFQLAEMCDADTVVIDSLKDAAVKLSDEETGQGLSRAMNYCVSNGVEVLAYHHQKKNASRGEGKPNSLSDVYGSNWITAGAGSVVLLWGNAGDLVIDLMHLKQPAAEVGPLAVGHDHTAGRSFLYDGLSDSDKLLDLLASGPMTAPAIASWLYGEKAGRAGAEKVRRRLGRLVDAGQVMRLDEAPLRAGGAVDGKKGGGEGVRYALDNGARSAHAFNVSAGRTAHAPSGVSAHGLAHENPDRRTPNDVSAGSSAHGSAHGLHAGSAHALAPLKGGERRVHAGAPTREEIPRGDIKSGEIEVCSKCHEPADRFIPAPGGKRWCVPCAYPTENPTARHDEED